ncbi:MAG: hypothetical protein AAGB31_16685 [Bdellovibrio sp.]
MKLFMKTMLLMMCVSTIASAQIRPGNPPGRGPGGPGPGYGRDDDRGPGRGDNRGPGRGPGRGGNGSEWRVADEVHFYDNKTINAINKCKQARERDIRCTRSTSYECSACSEIAHSDHSSYLVYERRAPVSRYVKTYHFYDKKTAVATQKCEAERARMFECRDRNYECRPCTIESHTDHSQFDLYKIEYR